MADRVRGREIDDGEGRRLVRIVCRDSGSVVTWRRARLVLPPTVSAPPEPGEPAVIFRVDERLRRVIDRADVA